MGLWAQEELRADPNGLHYGVQFEGGFAYVNWKDFDSEHDADVAIQQLGEDPRFIVHEIPEKIYQGRSK